MNIENSKWLRRFAMEVREHPGAAESLRVLIDKGCKLDVLNRFLLKVSEPKSNKLPVISWSKHGRTNFRRSVRKLHSALRRAAHEAEVLRDRFSTQLIYGPFMPKEFTRNALDVEILRTYEGIVAAYINDKMPETKKQSVLPTPDSDLFWLSSYVAFAAGKRHYRELADLVAVADRLGGRDRLLDGDLLRKKIERFAKAHPSLAKHITATIRSGPQNL